MKDYASMSDFEINSAVHNALLSEPYSMLFMGNDRIEWTSKDGRKIVTDRVPYTKNGVHDYCNNPADAWPIITATGISLIKCTVDSVCWSAEIITDIDDVTDNLFQCQSSFDYQDENPLRCAMIVFLMMKEGE